MCDQWVQQIPEVYRRAVLDEIPDRLPATYQDDPCCMATIRHYWSLNQMALEHRKPVFSLTPADGAVGSHAGAVQDARRDYLVLATKIADRIGLPL